MEQTRHAQLSPQVLWLEAINKDNKNNFTLTRQKKRREDTRKRQAETHHDLYLGILKILREKYKD